MSNLIQQLEAMRKAANLSQEDLATNAGLSRMTVQRREASLIDPRLSSVLAIAKTLNVKMSLNHSFVQEGVFWGNHPVLVRRCRLLRR